MKGVNKNNDDTNVDLNDDYNENESSSDDDDERGKNLSVRNFMLI